MVDLKHPTYYKYKVSNKKDEEVQYFFNYKYLKEHNFYSVKLPRLELREISY